MGCAPMGHVLYDEVMRYNPKNPFWFNRDRFVLSAGHGCMLQYALLHLAGYDSVKVTPKIYLGQVDLLKSLKLLCFFVNMVFEFLLCCDLSRSKVCLTLTVPLDINT